jgi:hypothetical protein
MQLRQLRFALINFRTPDLAMQFKQRWQHKRLSNHGPVKVLSIIPARSQGLDENLRLFTVRTVHRLRRATMLPVFFDGTGCSIDAMQKFQEYGVIRDPQMKSGCSSTTGFCSVAGLL